MKKPQPETRTLRCRACGRTYEYPAPGTLRTRHHCELCATLPPNVREVFERLTAEIRSLQRAAKATPSHRSATTPQP
jgi:hypothetical protein